MSIWYFLCELLPLEMLRWDFMKNALLAILLMAPLFGLMSTMIVTGRMSFFSDALGHSAFTGIAIGAICGIAAPIWAAVLFSILFALLFSFVRSRSNQAADTIIGVFSSASVALGIFIATGLGLFLYLGYTSIYCFKVFELQLIVDNFFVSHRVYAAIYVSDVVVVKATQHM